jgi:transcription elongation factor Elf1
MTMEKEIQELKLEGTVDTCPVCGYTDGFHVSFKVEEGLKIIILICPQCHSHFDPEWKI